MSTESMTSAFGSMATLGMYDLFQAGKDEYERPVRQAEEAQATMQATAAAEAARKAQEETDAEAKAEKERRERLKKKGMSGTILTSGLGVTDEAAKRFATILGG